MYFTCDQQSLGAGSTTIPMYAATCHQNRTYSLTLSIATPSLSSSIRQKRQQNLPRSIRHTNKSPISAIHHHSHPQQPRVVPPHEERTLTRRPSLEQQIFAAAALSLSFTHHQCNAAQLAAQQPRVFQLPHRESYFNPDHPPRTPSPVPRRRRACVRAHAHRTKCCFWRARAHQHAASSPQPQPNPVAAVAVVPWLRASVCYLLQQRATDKTKQTPTKFHRHPCCLQRTQHTRSIVSTCPLLFE